ncbi:MAG: hypothetical protein IJ269_06420 [Bacteroidales bacterium]|nr:hypothetical protein [Bacteroidales bacterium]
MAKIPAIDISCNGNSFASSPRKYYRYREEKDFDIQIISKPNYDLLKPNYDL